MPENETYIPLEQFKSIVQGLVAGSMVLGLLIGYYFYCVVCRYCRLADDAELAEDDDVKRDQRQNLLNQNDDSRHADSENLPNAYDPQPGYVGANRVGME